MTWNQPHRRFNSYTSILLIEFLSTRTMIKISSHFIPVFILLGDLIISLSLYADWWTKKWILWLYFWVLSVSFKILQLRVKTCIEDISTFIISYVFFKLIIILTNAPIEPITKNNRRKKKQAVRTKSLLFKIKIEKADAHYIVCS